MCPCGEDHHGSGPGALDAGWDLVEVREQYDAAADKALGSLLISRGLLEAWIDWLGETRRFT